MILKDLVTEKDGVTYCPVRSFFAVGITLYIVATVLGVFGVGGFIPNAKQWAEGFSKLLEYGGLAVVGKALTEKDVDNG